MLSQIADLTAVKTKLEHQVKCPHTVEGRGTVFLKMYYLLGLGLGRTD